MAFLERLAVLQTDLRPLDTNRPSDADTPDADTIVTGYLEVLRAALEPEGGELIHTENTSAIAIVPRPAGALRAVLRAHERLAYGPAQTQPPFLKAGAHFGLPAGGQTGGLELRDDTIELAARCCLLSEGGEVVVSDVIRFDPDVEDMLSRGVIAADFLAPRGPQALNAMRLWRIYAAVRRWGQC